MDSCSFEGFVLDPSKCSKLSMEEKRELVYEVSEWSHGAPELLQSWSRQEILQILCAEMGKERKYTGLTKLKIIEHLLKIVSEKRANADVDDITVDNTNLESSLQRGVKRPRKSDRPNHLHNRTDDNDDNDDKDDNVNVLNGDLTDKNIEFCKNSACRAKLSQDCAFCKRCSCCICGQFDDNKDPSLWLICGSDNLFPGHSCGMSCHLECALRHEKTGMPKDGQSRGLDGSFYCVSCGKVNDLLGCWRKQMTIARDTRRVDILCYRVSLSEKLLTGTLRYQKLLEIINEATEKLEADVGPLTGLPVKRARGIVNRLSSGQEVQRLCGFAVESMDSVLSNTTFDDPTILTRLIRFENVCSTSVSLILGSEDRSFDKNNAKTHRFIMWHRKIEDQDYPTKPTCTLFAPNNVKFLLSGLIPLTPYVLKIVHFESTRELGSREIEFQTENEKSRKSQSPATNSSSLSNPSSVEDENNNIILFQNTNNDKSDDLNPIKICSRNEEDNGVENDPFALATEAKLPITPYKTEFVKDGILTRKARTKGRKVLAKNLDNGSGEEPEEGHNRDFGYYVKVVRWLECEGHIDTGFRKKFLTWYSLRASEQEGRIVKVFVDTLMEDPASLAGQLVDTFSEVITSKKCSEASGLCLKLFH